MMEHWRVVSKVVQMVLMKADYLVLQTVVRTGVESAALRVDLMAD